MARTLVIVIIVYVFVRAGWGEAQAAEVEGLYDALIPVAGQSADERKLAMREGLLQVLVKVSGQGSIVANNRIESLLRRSEHLVQQYQYRANQPLTTASDAATPTQLLWARYDGNSINQALSEMRIPIWGRSRPAVLLWLAVDSQGKRNLVGAGESQRVSDMVQREAQRRGIPLILPLLDLQDQTLITPADVWGNFSGNILRASARYQAEAVLTGRMYAVRTGVWRAHWSLYLHGKPVASWETAEGSEKEILAAGIDSAGDALSGRYAIIYDASADTWTLVTITGVDRVEAYARVMRYLQSLELVAALEVSRLAGDTLTVRVQSRAGRTGLMQAIALGNILSQQEGAETALVQADGAAPGALTDFTVDPEVHYHLLP